MFVPFIALVLLASVPLTGGRLSNLAEIRLRGKLLIAGALVVQVVITTLLPTAPRGALIGLHLATYVVAAGVLWQNRGLPGLPLIGAGSLLNGGVIALNNGTLPASAAALARAGQVHDAADFANSGVLAHPVLAPLGDVLATPSWLPFRNVISVGDVLLLVGTAVLVHAVGRSWLDPRRWRDHAPGASAPSATPADAPAPSDTPAPSDVVPSLVRPRQSAPGGGACQRSTGRSAGS